MKICGAGAALNPATRDRIRQLEVENVSLMCHLKRGAVLGLRRPVEIT